MLKHELPASWAESDASDTMWADVCADLLQLQEPAPAAHNPRGFLLETGGQALSQASNQSETATTSHAEPQKALPLWGSLLLSRDRTAMEQLITNQTQAGGLVKLVAGRDEHRRQIVVLRDDEEAVLAGLQAADPDYSSSAQSSAGGVHSFSQQSGKQVHGGPLPDEGHLLGAKSHKKRKKQKRRKKVKEGSREAAVEGADAVMQKGEDEGVGESVPIKRKRADASSSRAADASMAGTETAADDDIAAAEQVAAADPDEQHSDSHNEQRPSVRPRRSYEITWFMALRDASQAPDLPHTDLSKILPTSYDRAPGAPGKGALSGKGVMADDEFMGKVAMYEECPRTQRRAEDMQELRLLYPGRMQRTQNSLCFQRLQTEAAFYITRARSWARTHLVTHTLFIVMLVVGLTYTVLPPQCRLPGLTGGPEGPQSRVQRLMMGAVQVGVSAIECAVALVRDLISGLSGKGFQTGPPRGALGVAQQWMLAHLLVHAVICLPLRLMYAVPKQYRLVVLEPVTQIVHLCTYIAHSWCPLCTCRAQHHLLPNSIMLCRNWLYLFMFPTRWCRSVWTQAILLTFTLGTVVFDMTNSQNGTQDLITTTAAKTIINKAVLAVPLLASLRWHKLLAILGFLERALPWVLQCALQCAWLYVSELIERSAFLVRRVGMRSSAQ